MRILAVIPARGGSKGIPRKNIRPIGGKPLIGWTIDAALASPGLAAVTVSTEDAEIAEVARAYGADVPFMRPPELAADDTPGVAPVLHALEMLPEYDAVVLLQPTSPLRTAADIAGVLALAKGGAPAVVSVCEADAHPDWLYRIDGDRLISIGNQNPATRRQDLPPVFALNGAVYFARADWLRAQGTFVGPETQGYKMPSERSVDIDTPFDWRLAELLLAERA